MMKYEFLRCLEKQLHVLNEKEKKDILSEYSQHIDFKIESGLSEENAIKDFGELNALACEILEAYNVNPNYNKFKLPRIHADGEKMRVGFSAVLTKMKNVLQRMGTAIKNRWCSLISKIHNGIKAMWEKIRTKKPQTVEKDENEKEEVELKVKINFGSVMKKTGNGLKTIFVFFIKMVLFVCMLPISFAGFFLIILLGILVVLAFMGCPVIGLTMIILGLLICCAAVVWLTSKLLFKKKTA